MERKKCINPLCTHMIERVKRKGNISGYSQYCSRECYAVWNQRIRESAKKLGAEDPVEFRRVLLLSIKNRGYPLTARVLGVTCRQLRSWLDRLPSKGT